VHAENKALPEFGGKRNVAYWENIAIILPLKLKQGVAKNKEGIPYCSKHPAEPLVQESQHC